MARVLGVALLGGIGFTVSLLIGELAFDGSGAREQPVKLGVLAGSVGAAILAAFVLSIRNRAYRAAARPPDVTAEPGDGS